MSGPPAGRVDAWADAFVRVVTRAVNEIARHWVALALVASGGFVALAFAAPVLAMTGHDRLADAVYVAFRVTCHQFPHRSWFLGGRAATHDWETVRDYLGAGPGDLLAAFHNPVRDPVLGYQVAFCQRDTAVFGALFLSVAAYAVVRRFRRVDALPFRVYLLALVPVAVDGLTQIVGLRESTPLIRTVTGALFGTATAWLVVPQVDEAFGEVVHAAGAPPRGDQRE